MRTIFLTALTIGTSALVTIPASAQSDTSPELGAPRIEEVIVEARRREESLQKVPVAVTAISEEQLRDLVVNNQQDLNKLAPGLQSSGCQGTREACAPSIRGQGTSFATNAPSVIQYFAGVPNFQISYFDLASLQVIKGPQGTLFGETATGGILLYVPAKPGDEFDGEGSLQYGSEDFQQYQAAFGGPIIEDKLLFRVAGQYRHREGFTDASRTFAAGTTDVDNLDRAQWRVSLVWKPIEGVENYTIYAGSRSESNGNSSPILYADPRFLNPQIRNVPISAVPSLAAGYEFLTGQAPAPGKTFGQLITERQAQQVAAGSDRTFTDYDRNSKVEFTGIINQTSWNVRDNLTVKNIYGTYWTKRRGPDIDVDGTDLPLIDTQAIRRNGSTSGFNGDYATVGGRPNRNYSDELQLLGDLFDNRLQWQTGYYYRKEARREFAPSQGIIKLFTNALNDPAPASNCPRFGLPANCSVSLLSRSESISEAGFLQTTYALTNSLSLTGGFRRTWDERLVETAAAMPYLVSFKGSTFPLPVDGRSPIPGSRIDPTILPKTAANTYTLSTDWQASDSTLLYLARRSGYKGGGVNENSPPGDPNRIFGPERVKDVELGAKTDWQFRNVSGRTNIAVYRDDYTDIQRSQIIPGTAQTVTTNLASATIQGVEVDFTVLPTTWFTLAGNLSYTDSKYNDFSETSTCGAQYFRPQCASLAPTTPIAIDHADGRLTIGNTDPIFFKPDRLTDISKWKYSVQPTLLLKGWTGMDLSIGANVYYISSYTSSASNNSVTAGLPPLTQNTILGSRSEPFFVPGRTLADLRVDWRNVFDTRFSASAAVTNVADKKYNVGNAGGFTIGGTAPAILGEPRLFYVEGRYQFGGN